VFLQLVKSLFGRDVYRLVFSGVPRPYGYAGSTKYSQEFISKAKAAGMHLYVESSDSSDYIKAFKVPPAELVECKGVAGVPIWGKNTSFWSYRVSDHMTEPLAKGYEGRAISDGALRFKDFNPGIYSPDPARGLWGSEYRDKMFADFDSELSDFGGWDGKDGELPGKVQKSV